MAELIIARGYSSPYDLWIEKGDEMISRSTLNYVLQGKNDPKATTLRLISKMLNVNIVELFRF